MFLCILVMCTLSPFSQLLVKSHKSQEWCTTAFSAISSMMAFVLSVSESVLSQASTVAILLSLKQSLFLNLSLLKQQQQSEQPVFVFPVFASKKDLWEKDDDTVDIYDKLSQLVEFGKNHLAVGECRPMLFQHGHPNQDALYCKTISPKLMKFLDKTLQLCWGHCGRHRYEDLEDKVKNEDENIIFTFFTLFTVFLRSFSKLFI